MATKYSVGLPVRNEEKSVIQTLESILSQTIYPEEIIVCVNGSEDKTYKLVKDMSKVEKTVKLTISKPGKAIAWNKIMEYVQNNFVMFCDGDVLLNKEAAKNLIRTLENNKDLLIVGGANAYKTVNEETFFSKYFTENLKGKPIKQDWICGRLYMFKKQELKEQANILGVPLMPADIINEDGFLDLITQGKRTIIDSAYNVSTQVSSFKDWRVGLKRIISGQTQMKRDYGHLFKDEFIHFKRFNNYIKRFKEIDSYSKRVGVTSLFILRNLLRVYYKMSNTLDYNCVWNETKSTKSSFNLKDMEYVK